MIPVFSYSVILPHAFSTGRAMACERAVNTAMGVLEWRLQQKQIRRLDTPSVKNPSALKPRYFSEIALSLRIVLARALAVSVKTQEQAKSELMKVTANSCGLRRESVGTLLLIY